MTVDRRVAQTNATIRTTARVGGVVLLEVRRGQRRRRALL
jgi:hypothetical protein